MDIDNYKMSLAARVRDAKIIERKKVDGLNWEPELKKCHHNVTRFCEEKPENAPVRGWLCFPIGLLISHSVVRGPNGDIFDITPSGTEAVYPFLGSGISDDTYADFVEERGLNELWIR